MSAYKDPSGRWRYRATVTLRDGSTERISGTPSAANTKLAATEAEAAHRERAVNPPVLVAPKTEAPTFEAFSKTWLAAYPESAENRSSTIAEKEFHVRVHLVPYWTTTPIDRIDSMAIATMITDLKKKRKLIRLGDGTHKESERTISPKTVKNVTQTLHRMLTSAHEWGKLDEVPKFPKRRNIQAPFDWYRPHETEALVAAVEGSPTRVEDRAALLFALNTGARAGEQLAVTWSDVDWRNRKIHFRRQFHKGEFRELKAGPARAVDMSLTLESALKRLRAERVASITDAFDDTRALVFPGDKGRPRTIEALRYVLRRYARKAGLRLIKWHELRHSFASQLVSAGAPLKQVQEWLGHSTIHMTMRYAHLAPTAGASIIGLLDRPAASAAGETNTEAERGNG